MRKSIEFTPHPIVAPPLACSSREVGACVEFQGIVREIERGEKLAGLYYEAYEPMALRMLDRIFDELAAEYPCAEAVFIHRLGWTPVGEASLFVRILAAHRGEALRFCAAALDRMKEDVPIWKRAGR